MKKIYNQPIVEQAEMLMGSIVMAGSPGALQNSGQGTEGIGDPIIVGG